MSSLSLSDREELVAIAAWRRVLQDRRDGVTRTPAEYAALFPAAAAFVADELLVEGAPAGAEAGAVVAHFRLVQCLGGGGQATVWMAEDLALAGRRLALKLFDLRGRRSPGVALRLRQEVAAATRVDIPGVCPIYETGCSGEFGWIAMRHIVGETLAQVLAQAPGTPTKAQLAERLSWIERAARTVHAVHQLGVVHRDLKPSNLMIEHGSPVVLDFGVAKALDQAAAIGAGLTATGDGVGTPAFMAPEQVRGSESVGVAADVWALGAVLFECATGERAFAAATPFELQRRILEEPHGSAGWRRKVPRDLALVLDTALAKNLQHRYQTPLELALDLERVRERRPVLARPPGLCVRLVRTAQRRPLVFALVCVLGMVVSAAVATGMVLVKEKWIEQQRADRAEQILSPFSDRRRLDQLQRELDDELAIESGQLERYGQWWVQATELIDRLPRHEAMLSALRSVGTPIPADDPRVAAKRRSLQEALVRYRIRLADYEAQAKTTAALPGGKTAAEPPYAVITGRQLVQRTEAALAGPLGYEFADYDQRTLHDVVDRLVEDLRAFRELQPGSFTRKAGHWLWELAKKVRPDSLERHSDAWAAAIERIAAPTGRYGGLRITPQEGLVPLGPDPQSGLEEFAHVSTGSVPTRDPAGRLELRSHSALILVLLTGGVARVGALSPPVAGMEPASFSLPQATEVSLAPFFVGKHEVTQRQWFAVQFKMPSLVRSGVEDPQRAPADMVDWMVATRYARRLGCALPTEAQWEFACRAGTQTAFWCGDEVRDLLRIGNVADARLPGPAPVGHYPANPFGLHDIHGNVAEWTADEGTPSEVPFEGPTGRRRPSGLSGRTIRGGSYLQPARAAQSWWRSYEPAQHELKDLGVRLVRVVVGATK